MATATAVATYRIAEERDVCPVRVEGRLPSSKEERGSGYLSPAELHRAWLYTRPVFLEILHMLNETSTHWKYQYFPFNLIEILSNGCLWVWWVGENLL